MKFRIMEKTRKIQEKEKKKICFFTGTRADYGLLRPLITTAKEKENFIVQIVASGMHLSPEFGMTYKEIEKDGFLIDEKIEILLSSDTYSGMAKSIGLGIISYTDAIQRLKPDIVVILGDRFEALAFAITAYTLRIPIAHLYGGETTEGSLDDGYRRAISQLSDIDFTSTEKYREVLIKHGKLPERVFNVGALGIDNIKTMKLLSKKKLENILGIKFFEKNLLITFHPETKNPERNQFFFSEVLKALSKLKNTLLIFTKSNADAEGRLINKMIDEFVSKNKSNAVAFANLGQLIYLSTMKHVDGVIGNSSSGIIEAPSLKVPTINIGDRQRGRVRAESVIDCKPDYHEIKMALNLIYRKDFRNRLKTIKNPYGDGDAALKIIGILRNWSFKHVN
ncbi:MULTISPECIES: UDP-N-acetylglucosamine 2-epimerase [Thermodesulfovibrio]|uniref:UDP-N-acetylglucosamine 2-epimerase n=1 Tax=Thermodesulfovibrio TaxID=28261 RepID=UPI00262B2D9C|nr:UDP-N-acetylglucosamine 2-epimerase [Thermodesulfovibrio sp.]